MEGETDPRIWQERARSGGPAAAGEGGRPAATCEGPPRAGAKRLAACSMNAGEEGGRNSNIGGHRRFLSR